MNTKTNNAAALDSINDIARAHFHYNPDSSLLLTTPQYTFEVMPDGSFLQLARPSAD